MSGSSTTSPPPSSPPLPVLDYGTADRGRARVLRSLWDAAGMLVVFLLVFAGCAIFVPNFFSFVNMTGLALSVATVGIIACTMLFCLAAGDFDLSVGSVVAMSG